VRYSNVTIQQCLPIAPVKISCMVCQMCRREKLSDFCIVYSPWKHDFRLLN